ncbi:hypothetical protein [Agrobacterium sp. NPDC090283]|uniref:hypothetical protein n=1 Tax=Agrobacterium sp. NPDC090283 TaxID=3363920 RepID=UPI00383B54B2
MNSVKREALFRDRNPAESFTLQEDWHGSLDDCHNAQRSFRHPGLEPGSFQPKSLGWKDSSRRADARRLDSGSRPE